MKNCLFAVVMVVVSGFGGQVFADGPIIAFGAERQEIRSTPILERENRPLHFYGNTVRRRHARQTQESFGARSSSVSRAGR